MDEFLVFGRPAIDDAQIAEVVDSLRSGWIGTGPKVERFERMLERYIGAAHVRCLSSCTAALTVTLRALGLGPGDEVLVPAMTFAATANAVEQVGAAPVFVDSEPGTGLIDLVAAEALITHRTRAIIPVHLAGRPLDMDALNALRDAHDLIVLEDAAHALGADWRGRKIGTWGNVTAYSFYVTKTVTTGEGGALATEDQDLARRVERLALHGLSAGAWKRFADPTFKHYEVVEPGLKLNMTDLEAALGLHQLPHLDAWIEQRAEAFSRYDAMLEAIPVETPPPPDPRARHAYHLYSVQIEGSAGRRDRLLDHMTESGIGVGVHYRALHLHRFYREKYSLSDASFPIATEMSARTMSLPLGPRVTEVHQERVVAALARGLAVEE
jgi:dTDP-4-amino-4,6-dideoxygalactose transaminase